MRWVGDRDKDGPLFHLDLQVGYEPIVGDVDRPVH